MGKRVNLALQGGGAHGAFGWGILDQLAEDGRLEVEGLSAASDAGQPYAPAAMMLQSVAGMFSPYQFNPFNVNPLRDLLAKTVDMQAVRACDQVELFICATNVRSGQPRIFHSRELTLDMVLASACVPSIFHAVEVEGEHFWDGGYMGNPPLYPLIYNTRSRDIVIVHINPIVRPQLPTSRSTSTSASALRWICVPSTLVKRLSRNGGLHV